MIYLWILHQWPLFYHFMTPFSFDKVEMTKQKSLFLILFFNLTKYYDIEFWSIALTDRSFWKIHFHRRIFMNKIKYFTIIRLKSITSFWFIIIKQSKPFDIGQIMVLQDENISSSDFVLCRYTLIRPVKPCIDLIKRLLAYDIKSKHLSNHLEFFCNVYSVNN